MEAKTVPAKKRVRSSDKAPTCFTLLAVLVYFRSSVSWTTFEAVRREYDKYRGLVDILDEAEIPEAADGVYLDAWFEKELL